MRSRVFFAILAGIFMLAGTATAEERHVPSEYSTIQAAINDCNNGDVVIIEPNTYTGPENRDIDFLGKAITVRSIDPSDPCIVASTIVDCEGTNHRGFKFVNNESIDSILEGLTITNAHIEVMCEGGAGIYIDGSSPTIKNCIVTNNHAELMPESPCFCLGGGIYIGSGSNPIITNCIISDNSVGNWGWGGGVYCGRSAIAATISNSIISDNTALGYYGEGGGIYCDAYSVLTLVNCTIADNSAAQDGGGIYFYIYGSPIRTITNSIIWGNSTDEIYPYDYTNIILTYSDILGGWPGTGNINSDPCFVSGPEGNYYLSQIAAGQSIDSPCIDAGSDLASHLGLIGYSTATNSSPDTGIVDLGYHYPIPDMCRRADLKIDNSNIINFNDLAVFASAWLNESCSEANGWCDGADFGYDGSVGFEDLYFMSTCWLETLPPDTTAPAPAPTFIISPDVNYVVADTYDTSGQFQFMDYPVDYRWWHKIVVDTSGITDDVTPTEDLEVRFICLSDSSFNSTNRVPIPLTLGLADGVLGGRANGWRVTIIGDNIIYDVDVDTYAATGRILNWIVCVYDAADNSICSAMHTLGPPLF